LNVKKKRGKNRGVWGPSKKLQILNEKSANKWVLFRGGPPKDTKQKKKEIGVKKGSGGKVLGGGKFVRPN